MSIGGRIRQARIRQAMTQEALAQRLNITKSAVANYENGVSTPKFEIILKLFSILSCDANYLYQDYLTSDESQAPAPEEQELLRRYRSLDGHSRLVVNAVIQAESHRPAQSAPEKPACLLPFPSTSAPYTLAANQGSATDEELEESLESILAEADRIAAPRQKKAEK